MALVFTDNIVQTVKFKTQGEGNMSGEADRERQRYMNNVQIKQKIGQIDIFVTPVYNY